MKLILALAAIVAASMSSQVHGAPALVSGLDRGIATSCDRDSFANHVTYNSPATRTTIKCTNTFAPGGGLPMSWGVESAVAVATEVDDFHCPQDMLISEMTCEKASCSVPTIQCQQAVRVVDAATTPIKFMSIGDNADLPSNFCTRHPIAEYEYTDSNAAWASCPVNKYARGLKTSPMGLTELICCPEREE